MKNTSRSSRLVRIEREHALVLERGTARQADVDAHLHGDDLRQRRLAEPGRPIQEHVVEGVAALTRRLDEDADLILDRLLADEVVE